MTRPHTVKPPLRPASRDSRLKFLVGFGLIIGLYYILTAIPWVEKRIVLPILKISALSACHILNGIGVETSCKGIVVRGADFAVAVRRGCDPLEPMALFTAGVVAFPARWRYRWVALGVGACAFFALNLIRIVILYMVGASRLRYFQSVHEEWLPALFIVFCLGLWMLWLKWVQKTNHSRNV